MGLVSRLVLVLYETTADLLIQRELTPSVCICATDIATSIDQEDRPQGLCLL